MNKLDGFVDNHLCRNYYFYAVDFGMHSQSGTRLFVISKILLIWITHFKMNKFGCFVDSLNHLQFTLNSKVPT